jgi:cobalamin biosynthesis Mg chelatase CobN
VSTGVSTGAPYVPPAGTSTTSSHPTKAATSTPTASATTTATPDPTPTQTAAANPDKGKGKGAKQAADYDTYLSSSEPVETKSAPVWVVPGILLILTSMLALLGGVLGRGNRPTLAKVKSSNEADDS